MDLVATARAAFDQLRPHLKGAVLICDRPFEQVIKWSCPGGFGSLLDAGVAAVRSIEAISETVQREIGSSYSLAIGEEGLLEDVPVFGDDPAQLGTLLHATSVVFMVSTHLARHGETIRAVLCPLIPSTSPTFSSAHPYSSSTTPPTPIRRLFRECRIISAISDAAHAAAIEMEPDLASEYEAYLGFGSYFARVESKVTSWMVERLESYSDAGYEPEVVVEHYPLLYATVSNDLFIIPSSTDFFPSLKPRDETAASKSLDAPTSFDRDTRDLASALCSILEQLNLKEEFFVLGETSKLVARCVVTQSMNAPRRKSENGIAVILVDRTHDLATPASHTDNLLDQMRNLIPKEYESSLDLLIDSRPLLPDFEEESLARCSLSHGSDSDAMDLLTVLTMLGRKDGLVAVRKRLVDVIAREVPEGRPKVLGKVTLGQMERLLAVLMGTDSTTAGSGGEIVREKVLGRFGPILQCIAGAIETLKEGQSSNWDELMTVEKVIALSVAEAPEASSVISPIRDVVSQGLQGSSSGTSSPSIRSSTANTPPRSPHATCRFSAPSRASSSSSIDPRSSCSASVRDALLLAVFGFALLGRTTAASGGTGGVIGEDDEMLIRDSLAKAAFAGAGPERESILEGSSASIALRRWKADVDTWTSECFKVLKRLSSGIPQRSSANPFGGSPSSLSQFAFQSLIRRIAMDVVHQPGSMGPGGGASPVSPALGAPFDDLIHLPYGGTLGSVLSGFSRLLGGGNRVRPSHFPKVLIFVVGGMTASEMRDIREAVREATASAMAQQQQQQMGPAGSPSLASGGGGVVVPTVLAGSTAMLCGDDLVTRLFPPVPAFGTLAPSTAVGLAARNYDPQVPEVIAQPERCCDFLNTNGANYITCGIVNGVSVITTLNVNQINVVGPIPASLALLTSITTLDISSNPGLIGDLRYVEQLPNLDSFATANNTGLEGRVLQRPLGFCDYENTSLCTTISPLPCQKLDRFNNTVQIQTCLDTSTSSSIEPSAPITSTASESPSSSSTAPVTSNTSLPANTNGNSSGIKIDSSLLIGLGVAIGLVVLITLACLFNRLRGIKKSSYGVVSGTSKGTNIAEDVEVQAGGSTGLVAGTAAGSVAPRSAADPDVMFVAGMLASSGPPQRSFSLSENRKARTDEDKKMDVEARKPFVDANGGVEEFTVVVPYLKKKGDELILGLGDVVVILEVYRDGWAEGISRRSGGPAVFPIACLGGGVPIVLAKRISGLMKNEEKIAPPPPAAYSTNLAPGSNPSSFVPSVVIDHAIDPPPVDANSALSSVLGAPTTSTIPSSSSPVIVAAPAGPVAIAKKIHTPSPLRSALTLDDISESEAEETEEEEVSDDSEKGSAVVDKSPSPLAKEVVKPPTPDLKEVEKPSTLVGNEIEKLPTPDGKEIEKPSTPVGKEEDRPPTSLGKEEDTA
ncbi:Sec1 domain-containing protein 2 [Dinochytrium kinnereticum]|nr:Sec1 domain-containing protein 2 [Dinochytrium kinnereticum]